MLSNQRLSPAEFAGGKTPAPRPEPKDAPASSSGGNNKSSDRTYIRGSRGGCCYMNGDKKVYVKDKSL